MDLFKAVIETAFALLIIYIFIAYVFPSIEETTGYSSALYIIALTLIGVALVVALVVGVFRRL